MADTLKLTLYSPHEKQQEVHSSPTRFKVLNWGRRTGKSVFALNYTLIKAMQTPGRYWIVAPTYRQAKNIYWLDVVPNHIPKELISKKNESELIIHLINGSIIEFKGADNADSLRGAGVKGLILDEYAFIESSIWEKILRPTIVDSNGWAIFISTPNGFNHFYEMVEYARDHDDWFYSHATSYDNPYIPDGINEINQLKEDYLRQGRENEFYQEYMGEFRKMSGLVYKKFDRQTHVVEPSTIPIDGTYALGIDFGFTNPTAVVFVLIDRDDNWWIFDEIYAPGMTTEVAVNMIQTKMANHRYSTLVGDSAAAQEIANFANAGLQITPCPKVKDSIQSGIRMVNDKLKIQEGTGRPKLFISKDCKNIIFEFESYHYPEDRDGRNSSEMPTKENDHLMDALRYLALSVKNNNKATIYKPAFYSKSKKPSRVIR